MTNLQSNPLPPPEDGVLQLLETHDDPVVLIADDYRIVATNRAYLANYGAETSGIVGLRCHQVSHHSDVPCHERGEDCPLARALSSGQAVDTLHVHLDADHRPERVRVRGTPVQLGGRWLLAERIERLERESTSGGRTLDRMIGQSPAFLQTVQRLIHASSLPGSVLLTGESGVGKELAARFVHERSPQAGGPFVVVDCASIPEALFESELFGHERGAFTGSSQSRAGLFETANGGTLFLDEIGELPLAMQAKLLRAIDTGEVRRLGAHQPSQVRVRIVAATNRDLRALVDGGEFRLDLFYRLATHEVRIPTLRERREDIALIARALLARLDGHRGTVIEDAAIELLREMPLPGNIRELRNLLQRALAHGPSISADSIGRTLPEGRGPFSNTDGLSVPPRVEPGPPLDPRPVTGRLESTRRHLLEEALQRHGGNRARVAAELGVSERTVYRWLRAS
ncbi:MAG: sigma 54-interacting transcriptional regulator [Burkholderiaceae bacterium]